MIKPWLFEFFHALDFFGSEQSAGTAALKINRHFDWYLDLWTRDEALGFEGIFFSEHHFGAAYSPSPNLILAAMAGRTHKLRLGTLGAVGPYATPWRVMEEIGMLDHLSHGRLEIGIVRGLGRELAAVGIDAAEAAERLWTRDEVLGFEGIFFSEHHFGAAYSPSPNLILAAMAGRTHKLRLGTLGAVGPYATPWRVMEEIGMLDHLSHGRLEIGIVRGLGRELAAVGIDAAEAAERYEEIVEVLDKALVSESVSHSGKHWAFENLRFVPPPLQQPPPVWTAVGSPSSARWAGRRGVKVCHGFYSCAKIRDHFDAYREAASAAGRAVTPDQFAVRRQIKLVDRDSQAAEARRDMRRSLLGITNSTVMVSPGPKVLDSELFAEDDEFIAGTAASVAEQIIEQCRAIGAGNVLACFYEPVREAVQSCHEQFGREVIPVLRRAEV